MVEASSFFILFEFLQRLLSAIDTSLFGDYATLVWGGTCLLSGSFVSLLKQTPGKPARFFYTVSIIFGIASGLLFAISLFALTRTTFESWAQNLFDLSAIQIYFYVFMIFFGITAIVALIASHFASEDPEKDSTLNTRQALKTYAVFAIVFCICLGLWRGTPHIFDAIAIGLFLIIEVLSILYWFYDPVIYIASKILPRKPKAALTPTPGKINRFAILVCAHNEEQVIEHLIDSLYGMNYPRGKYDIYVTCDNCRDDTATIVEERGAIPLVRNDLARRGKNEALSWMIDILLEKHEQGEVYDAYVVLSADNLVNERYLSEINDHLNQGHEIMQTYLGSKNPYDSWASRCSSIESWLANNDYQEARSRLNLSAQMRGTGMVFRPGIIGELTWSVDSLTQELNFASEYLLRKNKGCHWVHTARFYEEQPLNLKSSIKQRTRWMQGHTRTMMTYAPRLFGSGIKNHSFKQLDMAIYLTKPFFVLITLVVYAIRLIFTLIFPDSIAGVGLIMNFPIALILALSWALLHSYTLSSEDRLRNTLWLPLYYVYTCTWSVPIFRGFIKRNERVWVPTYHARNLTIEDISEDFYFNEARRRLAGLDNLHKLPLGQILLKAAIITGNQLETALAIQQRNGGFLGNILIDTNAISEDTLATYVNIQQVMRESSKYDQDHLRTLQLGQILVNTGLMNDMQLMEALEHQHEHGGMIGESIIELNILPPSVLGIFLEVQDLIGANYLDEDKARELLRNMAHARKSEHERLEGLLLSSDLVSKQQLETAYRHQEEHGEGLVETLLFLGYISPDAITTINKAISFENLGRKTHQKVSKDAHSKYQPAWGGE